jgi:hypothetical protein
MAELEALEALYQTHNAKQIGELLGRPWQAVLKQAQVHGIKKLPGCKVGAGKGSGRTLPIGTESNRAFKGLLRKVSNTGPKSARWVPAHRLDWEAINGPVPPGYYLVRRDQNLPPTPDNLQISDVTTERWMNDWPQDLKELMSLRRQVLKQVEKAENPT